MAAELMDLVNEIVRLKHEADGLRSALEEERDLTGALRLLLADLIEVSTSVDRPFTQTITVSVTLSERVLFERGVCRQQLMNQVGGELSGLLLAKLAAMFIDRGERTARLPETPHWKTVQTLRRLLGIVALAYATLPAA